MRPRHPDEPALHRALRDALNQGLTNTDFFVWIGVRPSGKAREFENLDAMVAATEQWLAHLNPDVADIQALPKQRFVDEAGEVEISAIPKKPSARGRRADQIVGNPGPTLQAWDIARVEEVEWGVRQEKAREARRGLVEVGSVLGATVQSRDFDQLLANLVANSQDDLNEAAALWSHVERAIMMAIAR